MSVLEQAVPVPAEGGAGELFHFFCCDENRALCGADLTGVPVTDGDGEVVCAVCADLEPADCDCGGPA